MTYYPAKKGLGLALSLSALLVLSACGGSDTQIIERDPVAEDDHDHDHGHDEPHHGDAPETKGRLLISEYGHEEVAIFELDHGEELDHFHTTGGKVTALQASPDYRFGLVVQRDDNLINAIDSGLYSEYHDDHWDYIQAAPMFMDFTAEGARPSHFTTGGGRSVVFFDGLASNGQNASVSVFSSHDMEDNHGGLTLDLDHNQHGAAQWFEGHLLSTLIDPQEESTLPNRVALYHEHDGELELEHTFAEECPGLHGSAQMDHYVAFGCTDGVLVIHYHDGDFEASKIANPEELVDGRIGSLYASDDRMMGVASGNLYELDFGHAELKPVDWRSGGELTPAGYAFDRSGSHFLVLDETGGLTVLEAHGDHWDHEGRIEVVTSDLSGLAEDQSLAMSVSQASHFVYVTDPVGQLILEVNLDSSEVHTAMELTFTPDKITWLGFEGAHHGDDHHEDDGHDHEH